MRLSVTLAAVICSFSFSLPAAAEDMVGFEQVLLAQTKTMVWYPTKQETPVTTIAENKVFFGVDVVENGQISEGSHPLAILSHGYSGLWRNQAWLAGYLAKAGYIVAAFDHSGTTFADNDPAWAKDLAKRPHQVSEVLSALLDDSAFGSSIDRTNISVIGHSLGGSTALSVAGGEFSPARLVDVCANNASKIVCSVYKKGGLTGDMAPVMAQDSRVTAAVLLDMEDIQGFMPESLQKISIPLLALTSGVEDPALPLSFSGRQQAALLPTSISRYSEVIGATHFSFMSQCKPGAIKLLEDEAYVCSGETTPRELLHQQIAQTIIAFLNSGKHLVSALQAL